MDRANDYLITLAYCGNLDDLKKLASQPKFDVNKKGTINLKVNIKQNVTVLWAACAGGHWEMVQYLIQNFSPDFRVIDDQGCSVFWASCFGGNLDVVKLIHSAGDIYYQNSETPLSAACSGGCHVGVVAYLIDKNHDVSARTVTNQTPLHIAASEGHKQVVEVLISAGAREIKDDYGMIPIEVAAASGQESCVETFMKYFPKKYPREFLKQMKLLVAAGKLLRYGEDSSFIIYDGVEQLEKNEGDIGQNHLLSRLLDTETTLSMKPEKLRDTKRAFLIYQQILGMGKPVTISAFRQYLLMEPNDDCITSWWEKLFECLSQNFKPLDDQLVISLREYVRFLRKIRSSETSLPNDLKPSSKMVNVLLSEVIRGYTRVHENCSWDYFRCPEIIESNFDHLLRLFFRFMQIAFRSADSILNGELLSSCTWMVQNSIKDSQLLPFIQVWLQDAVQATDHKLFTGLLKLVSKLGRDDLFARQDCQGPALLHDAISLKRLNVEIISHLLEHSTTQLFPSPQLFTVIKNLKGIDRADVAHLLGKRFQITTHCFTNLFANADDVSPFIQFAETISDKVLLWHIATACLDKNMLVEAMELYVRCENFFRHSTVFGKAMEDNSFTQWDSVVRYLTRANQFFPGDSWLEKELLEAHRMAASFKRGY